MFSDRTNWPLTRNLFTIALDELRAAGIPLLDLTAPFAGCSATAERNRKEVKERP